MSKEFNEEEAREIIKEVWTKRYAPDAAPVDKRGWTSKQHLQHTADKLTVEDWRKVSDFIRGMDELQLQIINLYVDINDEFTRGLRCSVCGNTPNQSKAIGYDCVREC